MRFSNDISEMLLYEYFTITTICCGYCASLDMFKASYTYPDSLQIPWVLSAEIPLTSNDLKTQSHLPV